MLNFFQSTNLQALLKGRKIEDLALSPRELEQKIIANEKVATALGEGISSMHFSLQLFAVLITILVIYFGLKVERSAIRAATDEAVARLAETQADIDACVRRAEQASLRAEQKVKDAERILLDLEGHKELAATTVLQIKEVYKDMGQENPKKR